ncbi:MAG TPA: xanthine dehydrogenase family protein molybdopterin-binding subunit [Thermodesulfobacteriota bacterium]
MNESGLIGQRVLPQDAREKAGGEIRYLPDMAFPGLLVGKVLRSPHPHALVRRIDASKARRVPGVRAVVTRENTPKVHFGIVLKDELPLAHEKVRYVGDEVAAVAAESEEAALEGLAAIEVEYEPLPAVFDLEAAIAEEAPLVHDNAPRNVPGGVHVERGDVETEMARAYRVVEGRYETPMMHQAALEPICCVADWREGTLSLWGPFQSPFLIRQYLLAAPLGLSLSQIRLYQTMVGGAFGGKLDQRHYLVCALLAMEAGRPVRLLNTLEEELIATRPRMAAIIRLRTGWSREGRLLAKQVRILADNGAYTSLSLPILSSMSMRTDSVYRTPCVSVNADLVYTNTCPSGQMRGFGNVQATFAFESHLDEVADVLGIDPVDLRLANATRPGDVSVHGWKMLSCGLSEAITAAAERIGWTEKRGRARRGGGEGPLRRGVGLAGNMHVTSNKPFATSITGYDFDGSAALVRVHEDGRVTVLTGEVDLGEGVTTTLGIIAAEELGVPLDRVRVANVDTEVAPYGLGTYASRVTFMAGNAVRVAAADARRQLLEVAARVLDAPASELDVKDGVISVKGFPHRRLTVAEAAQRGFALGLTNVVGRGEFHSEPGPMDVKAKYGNQTMTYSFACHAAEVEVDVETGRVRVLKVVAAHDLGRVINRLGAEGQIDGGVTQGIGFALVEELIRTDGVIRNPSFLDYKIPSSLDAPPVVEKVFVETIDPAGPHGAKGLAETAINPTAAAVANAIADAIGVRIRSVPITPEKILGALGTLNGGRA